MVISLKVIILLTTSVSSLPMPREKGGPSASKKCVNPPMTQTANLGGSITINCKYPKPGGSIIKRFCREDENSNCAALISNYKANQTVLGRFSLSDDKQRGVYTVSVSTLIQGDAGRYWCAIAGADGSSLVCVTEINLYILTDRYIETKTSVRPPPSVRDAAQRDDFLADIGIMGGAVGCLALLVILVVLCVLVRHKVLMTQGNRGDHNFEEIQMQSQQASSGDVNDNTNPQAYQLLYATINFQDSVSVSAEGNALSDTNQNGPLACEYSSISRIQGATQTPAAEALYSTVTMSVEPERK